MDINVVDTMQQWVHMYHHLYLPQCDDPLREIRYWMNNVYAHSLAKHPSSADSQDKPKPPKIILVGTHSSPQDPSQGVKLTECNLERVHKALIAAFVDCDDCFVDCDDRFVDCDDRFLDSIVYLCNDKGKSERCFFPVENSISKSEWYIVYCVVVVVLHVYICI